MTDSDTRRGVKPSATGNLRFIEVENRIEKLSRLTPPVINFGTISSGTPVFAFGTLTMPASYSTGGIDFTSTIVPGFQGVTFAPLSNGTGGIYTFELVGSKVEVHLNGTEVVATTNLATAIGSRDYLAIGTENAHRRIYSAAEDSFFYGMELLVNVAVLPDTANYWTFQAVRERSTGNEDVGDPVALNVRGFASTSTLRVADSLTGVRMLAGESLLLKIVETGTALPLVDFSAWPDVRRRVF